MSAYSDKIIADGASAYWRLGEASGTTAVDVIGGNNGTISGGVTLGQSGALAGDSDKAMQFNGTSGSVSVPDGAYKVFGTGPLSIECWIKESATPSFTYPLDLANDGDSSINGVYFMANAATVFFGVRGSTTDAFDSGAPVLNGQWHHVVGVVERGTTDRSRIYVDGTLRNTQDHAAAGWNLSSGRNLRIGGYSGGGSYFNGSVDEVAVYKTALTAVQIAAHYNLGRTNFPAGSYPAKVVSDGCSAYWRLGETSGTTAVDVIGGNNGTISGGVTLGQAGPIADGDKAMGFNGTTGRIDTTGSFAPPTAYTVEAWMKTVGTTGQRPVMGIGGTVYLGVTNGIQFYHHGGATPVNGTSGAAGLNNDQWHHLAYVLTPTQLLFYRDGVLSDTIAMTRPAGVAETVRLGFSALTGEYWPGAIDDVAIYPTALTPAQIAAHYALSKYKAGSYPSLVISDGCSAYWRLGETSGTIANDEIGTADGTISGGVTLAQPGALADGDKSMQFFAGGKVTVSPATVINAAQMTCEAWAQVRVGAGATGAVAAKSIAQAINSQWSIFYETGVWKFRVIQPDLVSKTVSGAAVVVGAWTHIVATCDGSSARIAVNGVQSNPLTITGGLRQGTGNMFIGTLDNGTQFPFDGWLDEVAFYPTALTAPQIAAHYAAREFTEANLPTVPWAIVGGMAPWSNDMDAYNIWEPITPHDTNDINPDGEPTDAILIGGAGDVAAVMTNGQVVVLRGLPAGAWIPIAARRINSTSTTATNLIALYQN